MEKATQLVRGLESSQLMMVATDGSGQVFYANPSAVSFFGALEGLSFAQPPPVDNPKGPLATLINFWEAFRKNPEAGLPAMVRVKTEISSVFLWAQGIRLGENGGAGRLILMTDLTEHVSGSDSVRRLISQLAHDLRSPLTSIAGAAELLLSGRVGELEGTQAKLIRIVDEGAGKMTSIIQGVSEENTEEGSAR